MAGDLRAETRHCHTCHLLTQAQLLELDRIMGDPLCWPKTIWRKARAPEGGLTEPYRRFGAMQMGRAFLTEHGYTIEDISKMALYRHFRNHVPMQPLDVDDLLRAGIITPVGAQTEQLAAPLDPLAYISFYNDAIAAGIRALGLISKKVEAFLDADPPQDVPLPLLKMMMDAGLKLAASQAQIKAAGKPFGDEGVDENEAFRGGSEISPQFDHIRVRRIEGTARPVADEGLSDRTRYNERARQEGGAPIGGR